MKRFQVIQGGKQEDRGGPENPARLFKACTISNLIRGQSVAHNVKFNWYCLHREEPPFPYEELIADYHGLEPRERAALERDVKKLFTREELVELGRYLGEHYGMSLLTEEAPLPIHARIPLFEEGQSVHYEVLDLSRQEAYDLTFHVWGYYTLDHTQQGPDLTHGVAFLQKALERLGARDSFSPFQLEEVCRSLYEEEGLMVREETGTREHGKGP